MKPLKKFSAILEKDNSILGRMFDVNQKFTNTTQEAVDLIGEQVKHDESLAKLGNEQLKTISW